jgi:hypothetical protein
MASGRLGNASLSATTYTALYTNATNFAVASLTLCNTNSSSITARIALTTSPTSPAAGEFIEYGVTVPANSVIERTGLVVGNGQSISVYASTTGVSAVAYGIEN